MRKLFSFLVLLLLLLSVWGCTSSTEETTDIVTEEASEIDTATEEASDDSELDIASEEDDLEDII